MAEAAKVVNMQKRDGRRRKQTETKSTILSAAAKGRADLLEALRDKIAGELDNGVPARDVAPLVRRLMEVTEQLEEMKAEKEGDDVSDAAATPDEPWTG